MYAVIAAELTAEGTVDAITNRYIPVRSCVLFCLIAAREFVHDSPRLFAKFKILGRLCICWWLGRCIGILSLTVY